jgi:hypothetical protein
VQEEFLRRINRGESIAGLFAPDAPLPDLSGVRSLTVLMQGAAGSVVAEAGNQRSGARLLVRMQRLYEFSSDCPVIDEVLAQSGSNTKLWEETGEMQISYQRTGAGWLISRLDYRPSRREQIDR